MNSITVQWFSLPVWCAVLFCGGNTFGQMVAKPQWAGADGRIQEIDQFHFDDAAGVDPWLDGRAAFFGQRMLAVVSIEKVQTNLGLDENQKKRIKDTYADSVALARDANRKLGEGFLALSGRLIQKEIDQATYEKLKEELYEKCRARYREVDSASAELLANILANEQQKRLKELVFQIDVLQLGYVKATETRRELLKLDETDIEKIKLEASKQDAAFKKRSKELRDKKSEKILKILTPEQRRMLKKLQGKPAELEQGISDK